MRDKGVCALCGKNTYALGDELRKTPHSDKEKCRELLEQLGGKNKSQRGPHNWWDADHILPVSEGGGECDLSNYRTLCLPCHKQETRELAQRRAKRKKDAENGED